MNPAFGPAQVRALTAIFTEKALLLRDLWFAEIAKTTDITSTPKAASSIGSANAAIAANSRSGERGDEKIATGARIDALSWLSKMTLDVIGQAGFNYRFNALNPEGKSNELNEAFKTMFSSAEQLTPLPVLQALIPALRIIVSDILCMLHDYAIEFESSLIGLLHALT